MKKLIALLLAFALLLSLTACGEPKEPVINNTHGDPAVEAKTYSLDELLSEMKIGWNLGNTLDAPEGETSWFQPVTTHEMLDKIHELGFNTVRMPVSWGLHTSGAPDYVIDEDWMDRVEEVVNYALDNDMFVIINSHHDNDFYFPSRDHEEETYNYIEKIWTQIAERFKDYDQHLIFQSMNEPRLAGTEYEWTVDFNNQDCLDAIDIINNCNQKFVDIVRASGGRNAERYLLCAVYCGSGYFSLRDPYKLPTDTAESKLLISVHAYTPYDLAMDGERMDVRTFDDAARRSIDDVIDKNYEKFGKNGVGVIFDEMGITNKNNPYDRQDWATYFVAKAKSRGQVCIWWDNSNVTAGNEAYGLFDRQNLEVYSESKSAYEGLMAGLETPLDQIKSSRPQ